MKLSFCIPTHHGRCEFLRQAIDGILLQAAGTPHSLQICISDNASEDGTEALAAEYSRRHPGVFVYGRNETNLGFLGNLLRVMELADGDFCWLMSSDDQLAAGGLERVQQALQKYPETSGITVFTEGFERDMSARSLHQNNPVILPPDPHLGHVYQTPEEIFRGCGLFHGCFSAQIVSRERWNEALHSLGREALARNIHFPHLYLIGLMVNAHPSWVWLPELTVKARRDNDALTSQFSRNLLRYQTETMRDLSAAWAALLGRHHPIYKDLMGRAYADQWNGQATLTLKIHTPCLPADEWTALREYTRRLYFLPSFWRSTFPVLLAPKPLLRLGFFLKSCGKLFLRSRRNRRSGAAA